MPNKLALATIFVSAVAAYDNGSPHSRTPVMGWSSWVALSPVGSFMHMLLNPFILSRRSFRFSHISQKSTFHCKSCTGTLPCVTEITIISI